MNRWHTPILGILLLLLLLLMSAGVSAEVTAQETFMITEQENPAPLTLTVANGTIVNGSSIPTEYTCLGQKKNPEIRWSNIPNGTRSLVCMLDDPDAPLGTFTHWIVYNIPPETEKIPEAFSTPSGSSHMSIGINTAKENSYYPPCPPTGQTHRYRFMLYALDIGDLTDNLDRTGIDMVLADHTIKNTEIVATFKR
ncbi:YbhB/YbcL family Raf kinase inhibitor-like protein [Methanospirillum sp.]|uniref:YbhB/YbcL family Raf kinase inhibitor-like protein n=1 Tax=Methanospirillum sp. TaxID=45200 RepID=UPI002C3EF0B1|nr:YbhB/YbcL family Raf kinase inhibitor-like protein [Methanospirillum sp.]HOL42232.1 YbhB/YbcL family Raf kinase inhibitor-like protein [Methanospirillum sp.]HPP79074.1 YbhB/YbcL family Raf kinase inhibitor-like protein [Methanospirillum sp.]